jgi:hypothetical protein
MIDREVAFINQANGPQSGRDGAATRGQERATHEGDRVIKGWPGEGTGKRSEDLYDSRRGGGHGAVSAGWSGFPSSVDLACPPFVSKWPKSSHERGRATVRGH